MKKHNIEYFEVCISPAGVDSLFAYWICVKGVREPSLEEAEAFLRSFDDLDAKEHVIDVVPIDEADAVEDYNFDNEKEWPVFGLK